MFCVEARKSIRFVGLFHPWLHSSHMCAQNGDRKHHRSRCNAKFCTHTHTDTSVRAREPQKTRKHVLNEAQKDEKKKRRKKRTREKVHKHSFYGM